MNRQQMFKWGITITLVMSLLSGCGQATPTPVVVAPASSPIPAVPPAVVLPRATAVVPATAARGPVSAELTTTAPSPTGGTVTPEPSATLPAPIDRPFLMKIDRISVVVGRGTLLEGRVATGTLQANGDVEILSPQNNVISVTVLATLISNVMRDQVTVGDYAGILVEGVDATNLSPGMLLAEAGKFKSYEEALQQLQ